MFRKSKCDCRCSHLWHNFLYLSLINILIWTSTCGSVQYKRNIQNRKIQSKRVLGLMRYTHRLANHNKVTQKDFFVETCSHFKNYFLPQPKNWHNRTTVLYTKNIRNTRNYSRQNQKTNTTPQLYCTLSTSTGFKQNIGTPTGRLGNFFGLFPYYVK